MRTISERSVRYSVRCIKDMSGSKWTAKARVIERHPAKNNTDPAIVTTTAKFSHDDRDTAFEMAMTWLKDRVVVKGQLS